MIIDEMMDDAGRFLVTDASELFFGKEIFNLWERTLAVRQLGVLRRQGAW